MVPHDPSREAREDRRQVHRPCALRCLPDGRGHRAARPDAAHSGEHCRSAETIGCTGLTRKEREPCNTRG